MDALATYPFADRPEPGVGGGLGNGPSKTKGVAVSEQGSNAEVPGGAAAEAVAKRARSRQARDKGLVEAARAGDRAAFGKVYDEWVDNVYDRAVNAGASAAEAREITEQTFVTAWRDLEKLKQPAAIGAKILQVARRETALRVKAGARPATHHPKGGNATSPEERLSRATNAAATAADPDVAAVLREASYALDDRTREVLDLHFRQGLTRNETAAVLGEQPDKITETVTKLPPALAVLTRARVLWRGGDPEDPALTEQLKSDGIRTFDAAAVRSITRFAKDNDRARARSLIGIPPIELYAAIPLADAPAGLKSAVATVLVTEAVPMDGSAFVKRDDKGQIVDQPKRVSKTRDVGADKAPVTESSSVRPGIDDKRPTIDKKKAAAVAAAALAAERAVEATAAAAPAISEKTDEKMPTRRDRKAAEKAAADQAAADKVAADKLATDKAAAEKSAADKVAADKVAADKLAADKAAAEKSAADKAAADKVAADKAAAEKAAAEKAAADKLAADTLAADKVAADKLAADTLAADKVAAEKAAAEKAAADKGTADTATAAKATAGKPLGDEAAADKDAEKKDAEKKDAEKAGAAGLAFGAAAAATAAEPVVDWDKVDKSTGTSATASKTGGKTGAKADPAGAKDKGSTGAAGATAGAEGVEKAKAKTGATKAPASATGAAATSKAATGKAATDKATNKTTGKTTDKTTDKGTGAKAAAVAGATQTGDDEGGPKKGVLIGAGIAAAVVVVALLGFLLTRGDKKDASVNAGPAVTTTTKASTTTAAPTTTAVTSTTAKATTTAAPTTAAPTTAAPTTPTTSGGAVTPVTTAAPPTTPAPTVAPTTPPTTSQASTLVANLGISDSSVNNGYKTNPGVTLSWSSSGSGSFSVIVQQIAPGGATTPVSSQTSGSANLCPGTRSMGTNGEICTATTAGQYQYKITVHPADNSGDQVKAVGLNIK